MNLRRVYTIVFRKELRELFRDRRALFWLFAPPIILPGIAVCAAIFIGTQAIRIAQDGVPVFIENAEEAPELIERFESADETNVLENDTRTADDPFGDAAVIVSIPDDFQEQIESGNIANIQVITKDNSLITFFASSAVRTVINGYSDEIRQQRLAELNLNEDWLTPIQIGSGKRSSGETVAADDDEDSGSNIVATIFLPLAVTSWLLGGGMGLILDTTVGEKERQTIENLLVTPASRIGIVMGKMTVVFIASMAVMSLWLTEGLLLNAVSNAGSELIDAGPSNPAETLELLADGTSNAFGLVIALLVMIIPFTVMLNGLVMSWCAYAANYREANLFMALIQLGLPASVLLTIFSLPPEVGAPIYALPFFGTIVAIRDLFSSALPTSGLIINFASSIIYAGGAIFIAAWVFGREWSLTRGLQ